MKELNKVYKVLNNWRNNTVNPLCNISNNIAYFEGEGEEFMVILRSDNSIKIYRRDTEPFANWDYPRIWHIL